MRTPSLMLVRDPGEHHRAATPLELFFDLVAVIAIASVTASLHHAVSAGHGAENIANFLFIFTGIWWAWMNYTWFANAFDNDDAVFRLFTIVIMGGFLEFAAGVEHFFETLDFSYSLLGWIIMRLGMMGLWWRAARHNPEFRAVAMGHFWGLLFAQTLWILYVLGVNNGYPLGMQVGALIFVVEFLVPVLATRNKQVAWHRHHIIERYGLLNTIVLGEVLLSISFMLSKLYEGELDWALIKAAVASLITVFAVWWIYFLEEEHLNSDSLRRAFIWGYGHLAIFLSGALLAVGLGVYFDVLTHHAHVSAENAGALINGAVAIYFATLWLIRDLFHDLGLRRAVLPIAVLALALAAWFGQGPIVTALICVVTLAARTPTKTE
ncbi:MAG TPA: low temperature requirement protein A [Aliiroseovarius sp.]|nr:low temperature requirement protein A [Aliiroseovarius sp.]